MRIRRKRQERTAAGRMPPANTPTVREAALAARIAELEAELRARNDFLAIAAHELRNPMTPISARLPRSSKSGNGRFPPLCRERTAKVDRLRAPPAPA